MDSLTPIEAPLESGHVARCRHWPGLLQSESLENWTTSIPWQQNQITVYGKTYDEPRLTAWFGPAYTYSSIAWPSAQIPVDLQGLNKLISRTLNCREFDAILCNLYRNGQDAMGWHRDNEREIDPAIIASVSLGAQRDFKIRHRLMNESLCPAVFLVYFSSGPVSIGIFGQSELTFLVPPKIEINPIFHFP